MFHFLRCFLFLLLLCSPGLFAATFFHLNDEEALRIGIKIWYNEGGGKRSKLTWWNAHENFASLGIGHFIWYPATTPKKYKQTFAQFVKFVEAKGIAAPAWLEGQTVPPCPWPNGVDFKGAQSDLRLHELQDFLFESIPQQVEFMEQRLENSLRVIFNSAPSSERMLFAKEIVALTNSPEGLYALIDYVDFRGSGVSDYDHQPLKSWGLFNVFQLMPKAPAPLTPLQAFVWAADQLLTAHATGANSRWLPGWRKRIYSYLQ